MLSGPFGIAPSRPSPVFRRLGPVLVLAAGLGRPLRSLPAQQGTGEVRGRVTSSADQAPIRGARVEMLRAGTLAPAARATTADDGTVRVRVAALAAPPARRGSAGPGRGPAGVRIEVQDEGCGIAPEAQATLFEPFATTKRGGSGLGLYITHDIVKRHGGRLAVDSQPGRGTTFTVDLPLENQGGTP